MNELIQAGLFGRGLIRIEDPTMVARYNACLQDMGLSSTDLTSFQIDRMGWSPEIAAEAGDSYYLTWAPDRISRNAGDLGKIVDLMDAGKLNEIRTFGQTFSNNPNEKFLLMILGSQAKLENDNRGINVKRGLRTRVEMGLWPGIAPVGYLNQKHMDKKCQVLLDAERAPIVKQMFEKMAYEKWSGRKIYHWLKFELNF